METTSEKKAPAKKIGNKNTEIIIGNAASKLEMAVKSIAAASSEVDKIEERARECTLKVVNLEDQIGTLQQDLQNKAAQNKIELKNSYETDRKAFIDQYCADNNVELIDSTELDNMREVINGANQKMEETVKQQVAIATNSLKAQHTSDLKVAQLEHEKKEADNKARIVNLEAQLQFMDKQCKMLEGQLTAERQAGVDRAKAGSVGTINVNSGQR